MAENEQFDLKSLQTRINDIKKEGQETANFTKEFIECLMIRHDLEYSVPEDFELEGVPESIFDKLRQGEVPSEEEITMMDSETQNSLLFELIWLCGMTAVGYYTRDEELEEGELSTVQTIFEMSKESPGHMLAMYLISVLSLLMGQLPSQRMIETITNGYIDDDDQMQRNVDMFIEWGSAVLTRHQEDIVYFD